MKTRSFNAEIVGGHKDAAIEVPFDPNSVWGLDPKPLWRGRRGYEVKGHLNGYAFRSFVVPRSRKLWMIVDATLKRKAKVKIGDVVSVIVEPL